MGTVMLLSPGSLSVMLFGRDVSLCVQVGAYAGQQRRCAGYSEVIWLDVLCDGLSSDDVADGAVFRGVRDPKALASDSPLWVPPC